MSAEFLPPFIAVFILLVMGFSMIRITIAGIDKRLRVLWRVEAKIDLLLQHAGVQFDPYRHLPAAITDAMRRGERLRAVQLYREASGAQLKQAVDFIDEALRRGAGKAP